MSVIANINKEEYRQTDPTWCGLACAALAYEIVNGSKFPGGQEGIKAILDKRGGLTPTGIELTPLFSTMGNMNFNCKLTQFDNAPLGEVAQHFGPRSPVIAQVSTGGAGHWVLVTEYTKAAVGFFQPWSAQEKHLSRSAFESIFLRRAITTG